MSSCIFLYLINIVLGKVYITGSQNNIYFFIIRNKINKKGLFQKSLSVFYLIRYKATFKLIASLLIYTYS